MTKGKAVVIDDEPDMTAYLSSILEDQGYSVRIANNAHDGKKIIEKENPDLILLDLVMPGRTGILLFANLKGNKATKHIPIIMVTGIKDKPPQIDWKEIVKKLKARVPEGYVEKPIEPERLLRVIEDVLVYKKEGIQFG